ncbi:MAG: hypothetical protein FWG20_00460 [Candidatus Cloacimonetes bacterium]|nr:hypothetical protein [Candidatus Cloacimonadota bacterium]
MAFLLWLLPRSAVGSLTIDDDEGRSETLEYKTILQRRGINFAELRQIASADDTPNDLYTIEVLLNFYENYVGEDKDKYLKVYEIDQIIQLSGIKRLDYKRLTFIAADGARVVIEPYENKDSLILLAFEKNKSEYTCRLILPEDSFSQRWLKNVARVSIK